MICGYGQTTKSLAAPQQTTNAMPFFPPMSQSFPASAQTHYQNSGSQSFQDSGCQDIEYGQRPTHQAPRPESIQLYKMWLRTQPQIFPILGNHLEALSLLTEEPLQSVKTWFANEIRIGSFVEGQVSAPASVPSLTFQSTQDHHSEDRRSLPTPHSGPFSERGTAMTSTTFEPMEGVLQPIHGNVDPLARQPSQPSEHALENKSFDPNDDIGEANRTQLLNEAMLAGRDRTEFLGKSCQKTRNMDSLVRDPGMPWQCTRRCGKRFSNKKNWVRHEQIGYPQEGWICLIGRTVQGSGKSLCSYCPSSHHHHSPTFDHALMHGSAMDRCDSSRKNN